MNAVQARAEIRRLVEVIRNERLEIDDDGDLVVSEEFRSAAGNLVALLTGPAPTPKR